LDDKADEIHWQGVKHMTTKAETAARMYTFIVEQATAGKTVYLQTPLRTTTIKKKHLNMVRVQNGALEIQHGKRWLDYTYVNKLSAQ
jgi:hypothetical protein